MLQDKNVERYVTERLQPLQEQIKELQAEVFRLMQAKNLHLQNVSNNEVAVCDCSKQAGSLNLLTGEFTCWNCGKITKQTDR